MVDGPYDVSLVEGSITTPHDAERIHEIRAPVATARHDRRLRDGRRHPGAAQRTRRRRVHVDRVRPPRVHHDARRPRPRSPTTSPSTSSCAAARSIAANCSQTLAALLNRHALRLPTTSVCVECKARSTTCVMVAHGTPCLGPVTQAGCDALCPSFHRGCYGCFGPMESPNVPALRASSTMLGLDGDGDRPAAPHVQHRRVRRVDRRSEVDAP